MPQPATPPLPVDGAILVFDSATNGAVVVPLALIDAQGNAALNSLTGPAFQHGVLSGLPTLGIGQSYFATDVNILYVGTAAGNSPTTALPLSGPAADIPQDSPVGLLYFATDTQVLYVALGEGNVKVVPTMLTGIKANLPNPLMLGIFYFATDTNQLYLGNASNAPVLIGPSSGSSGANVVQATVDFGSDSGPIKRSFDASAVVSASWVTNTSVICCSIAGVATGTHGTEDALIEGITVQVESVVAGVGFTLHAYSPLGSWGQYSFNCIGI